MSRWLKYQLAALECTPRAKNTARCVKPRSVTGLFWLMSSWVHKNRHGLYTTKANMVWISHIYDNHMVSSTGGGWEREEELCLPKAKGCLLGMFFPPLKICFRCTMSHRRSLLSASGSTVNKALTPLTNTATEIKRWKISYKRCARATTVGRA